MDKAKEKIIRTTVELMIETGDLRRMTIRDVAEYAGVAVGAINYHFQTKENLVNVAVRHFIDSVLAQWTEESGLAEDDTPRERFRKLVSASAGFLAEYPRVSRISILYDAEKPGERDNTSRAVDQLVPFATACLSEDRADLGPLVSRMCIASIQHFFLRSYERDVHPNFFDDADRSRFVVGMVEALFGTEHGDA